MLFDLTAEGTRLVRHSRVEVVGEIEEGVTRLVTEHAYDFHPNPARLTKAQKDAVTG